MAVHPLRVIPSQCIPASTDVFISLKRENQKLQERLAKAETIIEVQKKVSTLLGLTPSQEESNEKS